MTERKKRLRCAIYTRKSTDEGLEQEFNSLDAQRAACEAYVQSQAGEGWVLLRDAYDDGGYSGGNMERPALKRLLADIDAVKIDVMLVYKVDRLTRSLPDFARIVERFDAANVSFVSVTQAFNTTSSMGRLTLNVLLSFAQFEREVTGERIRDKIAASKARGIWMGGNPPLGYDVRERRLIINEAEAGIVRGIFSRYLELGSIPKLVQELDQADVRSKCWTSAKGNRIGGVPLRCGGIAYMLSNRIYLGEIVHKGKSHPGDHEAIIPPALFEQAQCCLATNRITRKRRKTRAAESWLRGRIEDISGQPMRPSFGYGRSGRRYRYYVSEDQLPASTRRASNASIKRVSAPHVERTVARALSTLTGFAEHEHEQLGALIARVEIASQSIHILLNSKAICEPGEAVAKAAQRLAPNIHPDELLVDGDRLRFIANVHPSPRGRSTRLSDALLPTQADSSSAVDALKQAHRRLAQLNASPLHPDRHGSAKAAAEGWSRGSLVLAFLAPDIQKAILQRRVTIAREDLDGTRLPLAWADQRALLLGAAKP